MKQHTNNLKQELLKLGRQIDNVIVYNNNELRQELYKVTPSFEGSILKSIMKQLDVETSVNIPEGAELNYQLGIWTGSDYEYLDYGNYIVYKNEVLEDKKKYKLTCYDKMLYAMKDNEDLGVTYPITIKNYLTALATKIGLTLKNTSFNNQSVQIPIERYLGLQYTYRDILDEIAQATGSMIIINADDELEVKYSNNTGETITEDMLKDVNVKFGQKYGPINAVVLSRAGGSDNIYIRDNESVELNGLCEIKITDNQLMSDNNRDQYLQGILAGVDGLYYYVNDFSSTGICYLEVGDLYNVIINNQTYQCLMLNDEINIEGGIEELVHTEMPEESVTDYSKADKTDRRINETYLIVDKQNQSIEAVISNVGEQDTKILQLTATVNELESKISDATDTTITGESADAVVSLAGINASEPVSVLIKPIGTSISYLYPRDNLYPSDTLYMPDRIIRFTNTTTSEVFDYELPDDLLYYSANIYDEFQLDFAEEICKVTKRCKYNADGSISALSTPVENTYTYPHDIELTDGDYTITIPGYNSAYLFVRLMSKNIYTSQFVTRVEEQSDIRQTATNINLSVDQKLTNYSTTTEMNSAIDIKANQITSSVSSTYATKTQLTTAVSTINQTTDAIELSVSQKMDSSDFTQAQIIAQINDGVSSVKINAQNINLSGYLTISSASSTYASKSSLSSGTTTINGSCITTGNIQSSNYESGVSGTKIQLSNGVIDSKNFKINSSGNVSVTGTITSSNVTLTGGTIKSGNYVSGTSGTLINLSNGSIDSKNFKVSSSGALTATNATISGNITATSGTIGGCTIRNGTLYVDNANINSINGSKISAGTLTGDRLYDGTITGGKIGYQTITDNNIGSVNAGKITAGNIHGCTITGGSIDTNSVSVTYRDGTNGRLQIGPFNVHMYDQYSTININGSDAIDAYVTVPISLTVQDGRVVDQTWRRLVFKQGILVAVQSEW